MIGTINQGLERADILNAYRARFLQRTDVRPYFHEVFGLISRSRSYCFDVCVIDDESAVVYSLLLIVETVIDLMSCLVWRGAFSVKLHKNYFDTLKL